MDYELKLLVQKLNFWSTSSVLSRSCKVTLAKAADVIKEQNEKISELEQKNIQLVKDYNELEHKKKKELVKRCYVTSSKNNWRYSYVNE